MQTADVIVTLKHYVNYEGQAVTWPQVQITTEHGIHVLSGELEGSHVVFHFQNKKHELMIAPIVMSIQLN